MTQLGQTLTNLQNYPFELNTPIISKAGATGNYNDLTNKPTNVSQFSNDKQYTVNGSNVSQFLNDKQYTISGSSNNQFTNDANYAKRGEPVSEFANDAGYVNSAQSGPKTLAIQSGQIGGDPSNTVVQTNIGLAKFNNGLNANGTSMTINHGLPGNYSNQTYIGMAQAYCVDSGVDAGILTTIYFCNSTYFKVNCIQLNGNGNSETHSANDMLISWQMSLVNFGYSNTKLIP